jgi:hypothetical protein
MPAPGTLSLPHTAAGEPQSEAQARPRERVRLIQPSFTVVSPDRSAARLSGRITLSLAARFRRARAGQ